MSSNEQIPNDLHGSLEPADAPQAQDNVAQETAALHEILKETLPETTPVCERGVFVMVVLLLVGMGFVSVGLGLATESITHSEGTPTSQATGALFFLSFGGLMLYRLYRVIARWKQPLFTLSLAGVQFRGLESLTPWAQVDNYMVNVTTYYGFITISARVDFDLAPGKPFDWPLKKPANLKYKPKKNQVRVGGIDLSPSTKKVAKLIGHYRAQSYALDRLAELEASVASSDDLADRM